MRRPSRTETAAPSGLPRPLAMAALALAAVTALAIQVAPLAAVPPAWKPDLAYAVLAFFALRRPDAAPLALVALLLMARDALIGGPPGLGALALLLALEGLRLHGFARPAPRSVWGDWAVAGLGYAFALALQWLLMTLSLAQTPPLAALGPGLLATVLAIPPVAGVLRYGLRLGGAPREVRP